ncbi:MAG: serine hydrolase domain-containing protein [Bacteroidota bacterium]
MYRYCLLLLLLCCQTTATTQADVANMLHQMVNKGHVVGVAAALSGPEGTVLEINEGFANQAAQTPFTVNTINRTASISKPMTVVAILQLVEKGLLELDATVGTYLPAFQQGDKAKITVRQVLGHTSGIRHYRNNKEGNSTIHYPTLEAAFGIVADDELVFAPGSDFQYTSYGYNVLGLLIEKQSGRSYAKYLRQHVWEPAGMTNTSVEENGKDYPGKSVRYHQRKPGKFKVDEDNDLSDRIPAGGIQSTVTDLLKFGKALMAGQLISVESFAEMMTDNGRKKQGNPYGLGLYLYGTRPGVGELVGHNGSQLGCSSILFLVPERQITAVVLANTSGALDQVFPAGVKLLDVLAEEK